MKETKRNKKKQKETKRNKKKQICALLLTAVMSLASVFCILPAADMPVAQAENSGILCTHEYVNGFCSFCNAYEPANVIGTSKRNNGTTGSVYQVRNAGQLYWVAQQINDDTDNEVVNADIYIADDITVNERVLDDNGFLIQSYGRRLWYSITYFKGNLYGNGHTIKGLYISDVNDGHGYYGFINNLVDATVSNLNFTDSYIGFSDGNSVVGTIAGMCDNSTVYGCYVNAMVRSDKCAGGIVGESVGTSTVENCCFAGNVAISGDIAVKKCGGIIGNIYQNFTSKNAVTTVKNVYVTGEIYHMADGNMLYINIICGSAQNLKMINCSYDKTINGELKLTYETTYGDGSDKMYTVIEKTNCNGYATEDFGNGTVCSAMGCHVYGSGVCRICSHKCSGHEYDNNVCKHCGYGVAFVEDIKVDIPSVSYPDETVSLKTEILPEIHNPNYSVIWSIEKGNATVSNNTVKFNASGEVVLKATVKNGLFKADFTKTYTVDVVSARKYDVTGKELYYNDFCITYESGDYYKVKFKDEKEIQVPITMPVSVTGTHKKIQDNTYNIAGIIIKGFDASHPLNLIIDNLDYTSQVDSAIFIDNSVVNMTVEGNNTLKTTGGYGPAIGVWGENSKLTIDGTGTLTADASAVESNAGIGSGTGKSATIGEIVINGGTVIAKGGKNAAGIGGGHGTNNSSAGKITINGGNVTAIGGAGAAGIGGGEGGACGTITINGGTVNAKGGTSYPYGAAGIGNGSGGSQDRRGSITINGGNITATGGNNAAGIGTGAGDHSYYTSGISNITITGGTIVATGNYLGAGIGGGNKKAVDKIVITGGNIRASGAKAIGSGGQADEVTPVVDASGNNVNLVTVTLGGVSANTAVTKIDGISDYGLKDVVTLDTNKVYCYISSGKSINSVTAGEKIYTCICKDSKTNSYYTVHDWSKKDGVCTHCGNNCKHPKKTENICDTCGKDLHTHSWLYGLKSSSTEIKIYAHCSNSDGYCPNTDGGSVTVKLKDYYYTGNSPVIEIEGSFTTGATYSVTYDDDRKTEVPSSIGKHTIYLNALQDGNDILGIKGDYNIYYLPAPQNPYTIVNGYKSESVYWFKDGEKIKISAPTGYTISTTLNGTYGEFAELSENDDKVIYLKNADGQMTDAISISETLSFDKNVPTGKIEIDDRGFWQKLLNKISFGLFFKGDTVAKVTVDDDQSGVNKTEYFIADKDLIADDTIDAATAIGKIESGVDNAWKTYETSINLNKNAKNVIYVKITDNVGNITYINSEGIVIYTDAKVYTGNVTVTYKQAKDTVIKVRLNGNTIKSIVKGDVELTLGEDYTVNGAEITLKAKYLNSLNGGKHVFNVTYNPLGMDYVESEVNDTPKNTVFAVRVTAAEGSVSNISDISKVYDGTAVDKATFISLSTGKATYEYKLFDANDEAYTTVAPKDAGKYVVRITVAGDGNYWNASSTATFKISKAKVTVKADDKNKVYGDSDPEFTWTLKDGVVYGADELKITLNRDKGEDVASYVVKASVTDSENPNYDIKFENGNFEITKRTVNIVWGKTSFVYDGTPKLPTATPGNVAFGDDITFTVSGEKSDAGESYATVTGIQGKKVENYRLPSDVTFLFVINKAEQKAPDSVVGTPEDIDGRENGTITGLTDKMEYRKDDSDTYTAIDGTALEYLADGTYYIRYAEDANHNASPDTVIVLSNDKKLSVKVPTVQVGYTVTVDKTELKWNEDFTLTFVLKDGYSKLCNFEIKINGNIVKIGNDGKYTFVNAQENCTVTVDGVADVTAPTASIILGTNKWNKFFNSVTFGLFFKNTQSVEIVAEDQGSGLNEIYYYLSGECLTEQETVDLAAEYWTEYNGKFNINPQDEYIVYAKITDNDNNVLYISSEYGIVVDTIAPVISGITDGETYYGDTAFTVSDKHIEIVTVDGAPVELVGGKFTVVADCKEHTIVATDKSGNEKIVKITVITIASIDDGIENITEDNVKSSDKQNIVDVLDFVNSLISSGKDFTDAENEQLAVIKENAENLIKKIGNVAAEITDITTKVNGYDKDKVTSDDKKEIQDLIDRITDLNKTENVTEAEKTELEDLKKTAEDLIKKTEDVADGIKDITDKVNGYDKDKVTSADKKEIQDLIDKITDLNKTENVTEAEKTELEDLKKTAEDLIKKTEDVADEIKDITDKVDGYDKDKVTSDDKKEIQDLIDRITDLNKTENVTETEKTELEDLKKTAEDLIKKTEDVADGIKDITDKVNGYDKDKVTSADKKEIQDLIDKITDLNKTENVTEAEKTELEDLKKTAEDLIKKTEDVADEIKDITDKVDGYDKDKVTSADKKEIQDLIDRITDLNKTENVTEAEKTELEDLKKTAEDLIKKTEDVADEIKDITDKVNGYDKDKVTSADKKEVQDLVDRITDLNKTENVTETEKTELEDLKKTAEDLIKKTEDVADGIKDITDKVNGYDKDKVTSDDKKEIQDLIDRITDLNKTENVTETEKTELEDLKKTAEDLIKKTEDVADGIKDITDKVNGYDKDKVTSADKKEIQDLIDEIDNLINGGNLNDSEKEELGNIKDTAEDIIKNIEDAASSADTENTDKVNGITSDNVKTDDKSDLENAKDDLEKALDDYGDNLTDEEKKDIQDDIDRINEALDVIEKTEKVEDLINKIPSDIKKEDNDAIKAADDAYNALTDYEQSILDKETKQKLDDAKAALEKLNSTNYVWLWIVLIILCVAALAGVILYTKNKKHTAK